MIRTNTTTNKTKKKTLPKGVSGSGGGGGGGNKATTPKTKTTPSTTTTTTIDAMKKLSAKTGSHGTKTVLNKQNTTRATNPTSAKVGVNLHQPSANLDSLLEPKKLKRANSFFLTRKLSKIYHTLTGSKDNLNKIPEHDDHPVKGPEPIPNPFKFTRSASLAAIPLRRSYRNSNIRESKLEQLREEDGHHVHTAGTSENSPTDVELRAKNTLKCASTNGTPNDNEPCDKDVTSVDRHSLPADRDRKNSFNLMSSLRRTFSVTPAKRKSYNPKWSASLMNLQQIDIMISYEDLSFINYDKFNTYEANLIRHMSQTDVNAKISNRNSVPDERTIFNNDARKAATFESSKSTNQRPDDQTDAVQYFTNFPEVKRRNKPTRVNVSSMFDRPSDVRHSNVETGKQQQLNRSTFRWSTPCESLNTQPFVNSNVSLKVEDVNEQICSADDKKLIPATVPKKFPITRCISCNSLRRTQSMNDMNDGHSGGDTTNDPSRIRSFVSSITLLSSF